MVYNEAVDSIIRAYVYVTTISQQPSINHEHNSLQPVETDEQLVFIKT